MSARESGLGEQWPSTGSDAELEAARAGWPLAKSWGLSLVDHSIDVAAFAEAGLRDDKDFRTRLARSGDRDDLSATDQARLCFLVGLHDAGKVNHGFQDKLKQEPGSFGGEKGHTSSLFWLLFTSRC